MLNAIKTLGRLVHALRMNELHPPKKGSALCDGRLSLKGVTLTKQCGGCRCPIVIDFSGKRGLWKPAAGVAFTYPVTCPNCSRKHTLTLHLHVFLEVLNNEELQEWTS